MNSTDANKPKDRKYWFLVELVNGTSHIMHKTCSVKPMGWSSISKGYDTEQELMDDIEKEPCSSCGRLYQLHYGPRINDLLREAKMCHGCDFWTKRMNETNGVRIKGSHYQVGDETKCNPKFKGHGGREFRIRMFTGEIITTTNLWGQGNIPAIFHDRMPDNAEFLSTPKPIGQGWFA